MIYERRSGRGGRESVYRQEVLRPKLFLNVTQVPPYIRIRDLSRQQHRDPNSICGSKQRSFSSSGNEVTGPGAVWPSPKSQLGSGVIHDEERLLLNIGLALLYVS